MGVGVGVGVLVAVAVGVNVGVGVLVAVAVGVDVGVGVRVAVAVGVDVAVGLGKGTPHVGQLNRIESKSGAQLPTIGLENSSVLQPVFKVTVVCIDPTVLNEPVDGKLTDVPGPPFTLR